MKKIIIIALLGFFIFSGCEDNNSILEPTNDSNEILSKYEDLEYIQSNITDWSNRTNFDEAYTTHFLEAAEIVELDSSYKKFSKKEKFSKNYTVNGEKGGILFLKISWLTEDCIRVALESKLTIPKGAYKGDLTFDMIFDLENYALELYPSPFTFDIPVILDMKFTHIDLSDIGSDRFDFKYLDGKEKMEFKGIRIDEDRGTIAVYGAVLHHFSRYGWTRTKK
jgi:hypothetical protein